MKLPYGISDFAALCREGYFYADRTNRIPIIEQAGKQLLFLRPRRFGKSLLLSMIENYYDVAKANAFNTLFGKLSIAQQPTPLHNQFLILKWDFSTISPQGNPESIQRAIYDHINESIRRVCDRYADYLNKKHILIHPENALVSLDALLRNIEQTPYRLYLLIDEYDNFANEIVMSGKQFGQSRYEELLQGEGILRTVFKAVKAASAGRGLDRVFITGVSPLVLSDMTSGYNVAENISMLPKLADLCGFTENEIVRALHEEVQELSGNIPEIQKILATMRNFYTCCAILNKPPTGYIC